MKNLKSLLAVLVAITFVAVAPVRAEFASPQMQDACGLYDNYDLEGAVSTARNADELGGSSGWNVIEQVFLAALVAQFPNGMGGVSPEDQFGAIYNAWGTALFGACHAT